MEQTVWTVLSDPEISPENVIYAKLSDGDAVVEVVGEMIIRGTTAEVTVLHVQGDGSWRIGVSRLRDLAHYVMELLDVDALRIAGAARTSGARPGRIPAPVVFRRAH